jgi:hypothetical protein
MPNVQFVCCKTVVIDKVFPHQSNLVKNFKSSLISVFSDAKWDLGLF